MATLIAVVTAGALALANYLAKTKKPVVFTILPMFFMFVMTGWAMVYNLRNFFLAGASSIHLFIIGVIIMCLELWMVFESFMVLSRLRKGREGA